MSRPRPRKKTAERGALLLVAVVLLGLGLRAAHLADSADSPFFSRTMVDGQAYEAMALAINDGTLRAAPFYQDPLYPYFLAAAYRIFGHLQWPVYILQTLLGCLVIILAWDTGRRLFDERAGLLAALLIACYRPFIFYEGVIDKTTLSFFLTALFLWALVRSLRTETAPQRHKEHPPRNESGSQGSETPIPHSPFPIPSASFLWPLLAGISLGLAALTRANVLIFAPLLLLPGAGYLRARRDCPGLRPVPSGRGLSPSGGLTPRPQNVREAVSRILVALAGLVVVIAPVSIRNTVLAREFVLTTTQAGQNFYIGNSPHNKTGQYEAPPWVRAHPRFEEGDMYDHARDQSGRELKYSEASRFYFRAAFDWMKSSPAAFFKLLARKTILYLNNFEVPDNYDLGFLSGFSWVLRLPLFGFGIAFAFGFAGILLLFRRSLAHAALAVFFVGYSATVIAFFVLDRYRLPVVPALAPFAGGMAATLWDRFRARRYKPAFAGLFLSAACFAVTLYPLAGSSKVTQAQSLVNLGAVHLEEGDTAAALAAFRRAIETNPGQPEAYRNLGILQYHRGDLAEAFASLGTAARSDRPNPLTHYYLGAIYEARGELEQALAEYERSVRLKPSELRLRFGLATALQKLGRYPEAMAIYDTMLVLAPDNPGVHHNRAVALFHLGRFRDAEAELETVRRLGGPINPGFESLLRSKLGP